MWWSYSIGFWDQEASEILTIDYFTRYQIIDKIRGENYPVTDRSIDFQIVGLRKKMMGKGNLIETIRGVGYRFQHHET